MFHSTSVVSFLAFLSVVSPNSTVIHRRKRYLAFPPKANFVLTLALLKGIPYDIKPSPTTKIITTYECDVLFPLPRVPDPFRFSTESSTRHRRQLHSQIEELLDMNGHDGRACVQAAICKIREIRLSNFENLSEDFLMILFGPGIMKTRLPVTLFLSMVILRGATAYIDIDGVIKIRIFKGNSSAFSETGLEEGCTLLTPENGHIPSLPLLLIVHGMAQGADSPFVKGMVDALEAKKIISSYNVLAVHMPSLFQNDLKNRFYYGVLNNVQPAGEKIGRFLSKAITSGLTAPDRVQIVGYSIGAQVAGYAARIVKDSHSKVQYIAGLDPAGLGFQRILGVGPRLTHVSHDDALVTHFFHTNSLSCGTALRVATADFVFNGGLVQPGCRKSEGASLDCSHTRIPFLYLEAIAGADGADSPLIARRCTSWARFSTCLCEEFGTARVAFPPDFRANGTYYLRTRSASPFSLGLEGSHCNKEEIMEEANELESHEIL